jgi:hypothetical protein
MSDRAQGTLLQFRHDTPYQTPDRVLTPSVTRVDLLAWPTMIIPRQRLVWQRADLPKKPGSTNRPRNVAIAATQTEVGASVRELGKFQPLMPRTAGQRVELPGKF